MLVMATTFLVKQTQWKGRKLLNHFINIVQYPSMALL